MPISLRGMWGDGDRVLDAGCGPGRFAVTAAELGATVTALDLSEGQLELAKATVADAGVSGAVEGFVAGDIADLSMFGDGQFDAVICYGGALCRTCVSSGMWRRRSWFEWFGRAGSCW